ncbi:MAG: polysaccharide biosynthesis tyrosine autokinase, partial [Candidatus Rokuibacteriota bacterium]
MRYYLSILWRRKWNILLVTAVCVGAALAFLSTQQPLYSSEAEVLVEPLTPPSTAAPDPGTLINMETEARLAYSDNVAGLAAEELGTLEEPSSLMGGLNVAVAPGTQVLVFSYTHSDPVEAADRAQAFAEAYLKDRRDQAVDSLTDTAQANAEEIAELNLKLRKLNETLDATTDPQLRIKREARFSALSSRLALLREQAVDENIFGVISPGRVTQPAAPAASPSSPQPLRAGGLALMAGLALGIGLAFLRERLDERVRSRDALEANLGTPVLAAVPRIRAWKRKDVALLLARQQPESPIAETYRTLRTGVLFAAEQRQAKVILVTSATAGEGKSSVAANLGLLLAQAGSKVVLVSADLRKPRLSKFFGIPEGRGLTNVLSGELPWSEALVPEAPNLAVLPAGIGPGNPAEVLASGAMKELLEELLTVSDVVLLDAPPVLPVADAVSLAPRVDGVLFVTDASKASKKVLLLARQQLEQVGARFIGAVLNNFNPKKVDTGYGSYYETYREAGRGGDGSRTAEGRM